MVTAGNFAPNEQPLRLNHPESPDKPSDAIDDGESDLDDTRKETMLEEEHINSVIGISISRAQTRLMSPQTPTAEKAAALDASGGGGFFDGCDDDGAHEDSDHGSQEDQVSPSPPRPKELPGPTRRQATPLGASLPSPWTAVPKLFEKTELQYQDNLSPRPLKHTGPTGMLAELNIKRFLSSLHMPSLPKGMGFKDLSVPSMMSIFGGGKDNMQPQKTTNRPKRASTLSSLSPGWAFERRFDKRSPENTSGRVKSTYPHATNFSKEHNQAIEVPRRLVSEKKSSAIDKDRRDSDTLSPSRATSLRRVKSDQSLMLRHTTSTGSTLGDDSRWEHVQDQVNSRFKAIVDSLQDSNIKLPSLPSLPNINLNNFRPDFTRNRAWSDSRKMSLFPGWNITTTDDQSGNHRPSPRAHNENSSKSVNMSSKSPKPVSHLDQALDQLTGDIVIMGGYRGSVLRSAKPPNRQLWVPVKVGLNIRKVNLEVGLSTEDEENMEENIIPSGMLSHIGPVDMGRRLLKRLRGCANTQQGKLRVHDYGYDWRLSPHLLSRKLVGFLEKLPSNASEVPRREKGATIIAHSLGGLITRHAANQRPDLFAGILYAGTPQHCINILGPIRKGDDVLLSSRVLTAQVNFTLRTSFLLLPENGKCFIDKQTKEEYPVNFFDVENWKEHAFSPCIAPTLPAAGPSDRKGILGTVSGSLPSLPLPVKRPSLLINSSRCSDTKEPNLNATPNAKLTLDELTNPVSRALDPQLGSSASISTQCTIPIPAAIEYLTRTLAATLAFKAELVFQPRLASQNRYPPLSILYSTSVPTVLAARVSSREAIRRADAYDDLAFGSGDGVCLARAAMLPKGYEYVQGGRVRTERGHVGLLGDLDAVGKCLCAMLEARRKGVGWEEKGS